MYLNGNAQARTEQTILLMARILVSHICVYRTGLPSHVLEDHLKLTMTDVDLTHTHLVGRKDAEFSHDCAAQDRKCCNTNLAMFQARHPIIVGIDRKSYRPASASTSRVLGGIAHAYCMRWAPLAGDR